MLISLPKLKNIISMTSEDISLLDYDDETNILTCKISYMVDQKLFVQNNVNTALIYVYSQRQKNNETLDLDDIEKSDSIYHYIAEKKDIQLRDISENVISIIQSDINSKIDKDDAKKIINDENFNIIKNKITFKRVSTLINNKKQNTILNTSKKNKDKYSNEKKQNRSSQISKMLRLGADPSDVAFENSNDTLQNNFSGTSRIKTKKYNSQEVSDTMSKIFNDIIDDNNSDDILNKNPVDLIAIKEDIENNNLIITEILSIDLRTVLDNNLYINLELLDNFGIPIDSIEIIKKDVSSQINALSNDLPAPELTITSDSEQKNIILSINKIHNKTKRFNIYEKTFNKFNSSIKPKFKKIKGDFFVAGTKNMKISLYNLNDDTKIYRVIPVGTNSITSNSFASAVYSNGKELSTVSGITSINSNGGIKLTMRNPPVDSISYCVLKRNLTRAASKSKFLQVSKFILLGESLSFFDSEENLLENDIYEYKFRFMTKRGNIIDSQNTTMIKYQKLSLKSQLKAVTSQPTIIQNINLSSNTYDVSFELNVDIQEETIDTVLGLLNNNNISEYFSNEIEERKKQFSQLVMFNVVRKNITNMEPDVQFNPVGIGTFIDSEQSRSIYASPPTKDETYNYVVTAHLRHPDEILEQISPNKTKPLFRHRNALLYGNVSTPETISKYYPNNQFLFSDSSDKSIVTAKQDDKFLSPTIGNVSVSVINGDKVLIKWSMSSTKDLDEIDHFLIMRKSSSERTLTILGRVHSQQNSQILSYTHELSPNDFGTVSYIVRGVLNDYIGFIENESEKSVLR